MRLLIAALAFAALAACGSPNAANNIAAPVGNGAIPPVALPVAGDDATGLARFRAEALEACIGGGRDAAPPGTPVERHCACAIERATAGRTLAELEADQRSGDYGRRFSVDMRACIREIPR